MLVQFAVENFMSFRQEAVLSMLAAKRKSQDKELDLKSTFSTDFDLPLLKSAVIYGANASGKSNIFKAIRFMKDFVINSSKESQQDEEIDITPFRLNTLSLTEPSKFSVIFIHEDNLYEYKFSTSRTRVESESLKIRHKTEDRDRPLFTRNGDKINVNKSFPEGKGLEKRTRANALFLSVCANFDGVISAAVISWFRKVRVINGLADTGLLNFTTKKLKDADSNVKILKILDAFDIGITKIKVTERSEETLPEAFKAFRTALQSAMPTNAKFDIDMGQIFTEHQVFDNDGVAVGVVDFNLGTAESEGTKKLVALAGPLLDALEKSYIIFLDELDARLHPLLSLQILQLFNCNVKNKLSSQLITATHSTNLLDKNIIRRDQVWLTSKNSLGESSLTSLVEYKVRNDASFEKDYLLGKYGAIPLIGELDI